MGYSKWRKRTKEEIDEAALNRDFTGGYEWGPWLLHMRLWYILGFLANFCIGWIGGVYSIIDDPGDWIGYAVTGFFGAFVPGLIIHLLRRDYKLSKKGISS